MHSGSGRATNTSTLRPSDFAAETGRPEKFLALHFANLVWRYNTGEVMVAQHTDRKYFETVLEFAAEIGLAPVPILKETPGYLLNSLLVPWLNEGATLHVNGVANPADIDNVWRTATQSPSGPFQVFDIVGFNVAANLSRASGDETLVKFADLLQKGIDAGKAGLGDGEGLYTYDSDGNVQEPVASWNHT